MTQPVSAAPSDLSDGSIAVAGQPDGTAKGQNSLGLGPVGDLIGGDWPVQAADTIERVIGGVRRKTTGPAIVASRAVVYGIVGTTFALIAVVLLIVAVIRLADVVLPIWAVDVIIGGVLGLGGILALRRAHRPAADDA